MMLEGVGECSPLGEPFFARDTATVARELLGKVLVTRVADAVVAGIIVEAEAYLGAHDPGSHAATKGITARNRVMFGPPGHAYVYFTYGNHYMLNVVTERDGVAGAVLIRAVQPTHGVETMASRRHGISGVNLTNGPGKVTQAFAVDLRHNGAALGDEIVICDARRPSVAAIGTGGRVGLTRGRDLQLRFYLLGSEHVSKGRTGPGAPRRRAGTTKGEAR